MEIDIIKDNEPLRALIKEAIADQELRLIDIQEAGKDVSIAISSLSRYLNGYKGKRSVLTHGQILWLAKRFKIDVFLTVQPQKKKKNGKAAKLVRG